MITRAVITASGTGSRLGALTRYSNKCLLRVHAKPLILDIIEKLQSRGLADITVTTGHARERVEDVVRGRAVPVFNPDYATTGIIASLWQARDRLAGEPFLFTTGDHFFHPAVLVDCLRHAGGVRFVVQSRDILDAESSKVVIRGERVVRFGKDIPADEASGEFAGMAAFDAASSASFFDLIAACLGRGATQLYVMDILNLMIERGIGPWSWAACGPAARIEIDTVKDLRRARRLAATFAGFTDGASEATLKGG